MAKPQEDYDFTVEFAKLFIPPQKPPQPSSLLLPPDMARELISYPAVGLATQCADHVVPFVAALEVDRSQSDKPWQVSVWGSIDDGPWSETVLGAPDQSSEPWIHNMQGGAASTIMLYFEGKFTVGKTMSFTLRYRCGDTEWKWIKDEKGRDDGVVVINKGSTRDGIDIKLESTIEHLNTSLAAHSELSETPNTRVWSIRAPVGPSQEDKSCFADHDLGLPWGGFLRWFALVRAWSPWLAPRHGRERFSLDNDAVMCAFLSREGRHMVLLAVSGIGHVSTVLRSGDSNGSTCVRLHIRNDAVRSQEGIVIVAVGDNFESANAAAMYHARKLLTYASRDAFAELEMQIRDLSTASEKQNSSSSGGGGGGEIGGGEGDVRANWMEDWVDGLGYCTWNGLGQRLTARAISNALSALEERNIHVSNLIIDDNWQTIDYEGDSQFQYGWKEFEAEPEGFPNGLAEAIHTIRRDHPSLQHVAVWHALLGYWGGISPKGRIAQSYKTMVVVREEALRRNLPLGGPITVVAPEDVGRLYNDFYGFLAGVCGVDGVKTDAQFMTDMFVSASTRRALIDEYLSAWTLATLRHFGSRAISCMSQTPHILFRSLMPTNRPAVLCRNSDDFWPEIPASHPWHVWSNAHNALLTQHLNVFPDWDMFQTVHDYSAFHAAARCVSGGPIYITDKPGQHDVKLVEQMTGRTIRGHTVIFRPSVLGRALDQYVCYDDDAILKVGAYNGPAVTGTPIVGIFNTTINPQSALIPLATFPGVLPGLPYVVRSHVTGTLTAPLILPDPSDLTTSSTSYTLTPPYVTASQSSDARPTVIRTAAWGGSLGTAYSTPGGRQFSTAAPSASSAATATKGVLPVPSSTLFQVTLPVRGFDILTAHPVMTLRVSATNDGHTQNMTVVTAWQAPLAWRCVTTHEDGANTSTVTSFRDVLIAHLGLLDKMTGAAALLPGTMIGIRDDGDDDDSEKKKPTGMRMNVVATARLKALGIVGLYVSALPEINLEEDSMVTIRGQPVPFDTVQVRDGNEGKVLGVDVAKAWDEMGFGSGGWSNEVEVKIYFRVKALEYH